MYFTAVELKRGENQQDAIRHFIEAAAEEGVRFRRLEVFGPIEFGCTRFIRFSTDCSVFPPIITRMKSARRSIIAPTNSGYRAFLANGREGSVGLAAMHHTPLPGYGNTYLGPSHPHWKEQFLPGASGPAKAVAPPVPEAAGV